MTDREKEVWRPIEGYEGLYEVSSIGRIKTVANKWKKEKIRKTYTNKKGYVNILLSKNHKYKVFQIHRLVAQAFIPNPNNLPVVNHKDRNPSNNCVYNLEWCTQQHNIHWDGALERRAETQRKHNKRSISVCQYSLDGELIATYPSIKEAARQTGSSNGNISNCLLGRQIKHNGFIWKRAI